MNPMRNGRKALVAVSGALVVAGALASVTAVPSHLSARTDPGRAGLVAIVGLGYNICGDNNKVNMQGGNGTTTNKACLVPAGTVLFRGPKVGRLSATIGPVIIG